MGYIGVMHATPGWDAERSCQLQTEAWQVILFRVIANQFTKTLESLEEKTRSNNSISIMMRLHYSRH